MPPKFCLWILLLLHVRHCCCKLSRKSNEPNLRKWQKIQFQDQFWPLWPKLGPQNFFNRFYLYYMLDIVASYHCMRFQGKLTNQTWENGKKPSFGTYFGPFGPNLGPQKLCSWILLLLHVRHCCKLSRKTNNQTGEYSKKPSFGQPIFFFFKNLARSVIRYHGQLSSCTISEKPIDSILKKLDRRTDGRVIS